MTPRQQRLHDALNRVLGAKIAKLSERLGELTLEVRSADYRQVALTLRDHPELGFEQLLDLCGVDYSAYNGWPSDAGRFAATSQLLSIAQNHRLRLRVFCADAEFPRLDSLVDVWSSVNWYEREAFDLFGIVFDGHPDLRRILTDYGFIGHPFRKDFPISGYVEMRYDAEQKRVVYQPVTIEPREIVPRIVREEQYGEGRG